MGGSTSKPKTPSNTSLSPSPPQMPLRAATDTTPDVSCTLRRAKSDKNVRKPSLTVSKSSTRLPVREDSADNLQVSIEKSDTKVMSEYMVVEKTFNEDQKEEHTPISRSQPNNSIITKSTSNTSLFSKLENEMKYTHISDWLHLSEDDRQERCELTIQDAIRCPHPSYNCLSPLPIRTTETATPLNSEFFANQPGIEMSDKHVVYDIPSQLLRLRNNKKRANRSKADPWRRFGAYNLLCEIGGTMIDSAAGNKNKTNKSYVNIKPGTVPPPAPQVKPLLTVEDYMTFKLEGNQARKSDSFNDC